MSLFDSFARLLTACFCFSPNMLEMQKRSSIKKIPLSGSLVYQMIMPLLACAARRIVWLKFWRRSRDPKKGVGMSRLKYRLVQQFRRQISLD